MMKTNDHSSNLARSIAIAEGTSTAVSLGSIWAMQKYPQALAPLQGYLADTLIYPALARHTPPTSETQKTPLKKTASERASLLIKGATMIGVGFAAHVPIQMALEGRFDRAGLKSAAFGKSAGLGVSLGSILLLNQLAPKALPAVQQAIYPLVKPFLPKDERGRDSRQAEEVAKLLILDVPASVVAGLINYATHRRGR